MSFLDKITAAIMPPESAQDREAARRQAMATATEGDFLAIVISHHRQLETAFEEALNAPDAPARTAALKRLTIMLTGHANAEESVLYPVLADIGEKAHAAMAYQEQALTKIQLAKLEFLDPMSEEWIEKLDSVQGAVRHHMYEEEAKWLPDLHAATPESHRSKLTQRFVEEYERYTSPRQLVAAASGASFP